MKIGRALRVVRSAKGWTQGELAKRAEFDPSTISLIEAGKRQPAMRAVERLARVLGVPFHLLMLLAADDGELRELSAGQAEEVGRTLLRLVNEPEGEVGQLWL